MCPRKAANEGRGGCVPEGGGGGVRGGRAVLVLPLSPRNCDTYLRACMHTCIHTYIQLILTLEDTEECTGHCMRVHAHVYTYQVEYTIFIYCLGVRIHTYTRARSRARPKRQIRIQDIPPWIWMEVSR